MTTDNDKDSVKGKILAAVDINTNIVRSVLYVLDTPTVVEDDLGSSTAIVVKLTTANHSCGCVGAMQRTALFPDTVHGDIKIVDTGINLKDILSSGNVASAIKNAVATRLTNISETGEVYGYE